MSEIYDTVMLSPWKKEWAHEFHLEKQCIIGAMLANGDKPNETFYVHLCNKDHQVAQDQLLFQQIERTNKVVAANYAELKLQLAEAFPEDRDRYRMLKGLYIDSILNVWRTRQK